MRVMARVWPNGDGAMWVEHDSSLVLGKNGKLDPKVDGGLLSFWSPQEGEDGLPPEDPEGAALLGSSKVPNSQDVGNVCEIRGAQRGAKGITVYGARLVKNGCYLLQNKYGKERLSFLTTTLPGSPEMTTLAASGWGEITRRFMQALKEKLVREGLPPFIVSVSEVQMKRFMDTGGMPLHLHLVFVGRPLDNAPWALKKEWVNKCWKTAVCGVIPAMKGENFGPSTRVERVEKDAGGYLGKYMSKGAATVDFIIQEYPDLYEFLPKAWYNLTREMRTTVLGYVAYGPAAGECIEEMSRHVTPQVYFRWFKTVPLLDREGRIIKKFAVFSLTNIARKSIRLPLNPNDLHEMPDT